MKLRQTVKSPKGFSYVLLEFDKLTCAEWFIADSDDFRYIAALADHVIENRKTHLHTANSCLKILCVEN